MIHICMKDHQKSLLKNVYADVFKLIDSPQPQIDFDDYHNSRIGRLKKLRVFLANTFGIILINSKAELNLKKKEGNASYE